MCDERPDRQAAVALVLAFAQKAAARPMKKHNNNKRKEKTNLLSETLKKIKKNLDKLKFGILASRKGFIYDIGN